MLLGLGWVGWLVVVAGVVVAPEAGPNRRSGRRGSAEQRSSANRNGVLGGG